LRAKNPSGKHCYAEKTPKNFIIFVFIQHMIRRTNYP
jgi:hypothetical protein